MSTTPGGPGGVRRQLIPLETVMVEHYLWQSVLELADRRVTTPLAIVEEWAVIAERHPLAPSLTREWAQPRNGGTPHE